MLCSGSMHWSEILHSDNCCSENTRSENTHGASEWPLMVKQLTIKFFFNKTLSIYGRCLFVFDVIVIFFQIHCFKFVDIAFFAPHSS